MKEVKIVMSTLHTLTPIEEERLLVEYTNDEETVLSDIAEWQLNRYNNLIDKEVFKELDPFNFVQAILQMLWEKQRYGYPWKEWAGLRSRKVADVNIWIIPPKKPKRGRGGNYGNGMKGIKIQ